MRRSDSKAHRCWRNMRYRCMTSTSSLFKKYGARGITVCERWQKFENFLADMGEPPTNKHSIDRKDGTKGYSKANCRWATPKEQSANLKSNRLLTFKKLTLPVREWARRTGIHRATINGRLRAGWPIEKVLTAGHAYRQL